MGKKIGQREIGAMSGTMMSQREVDPYEQRRRPYDDEPTGRDRAAKGRRNDDRLDDEPYEPERRGTRRRNDDRYDDELDDRGRDPAPKSRKVDLAPARDGDEKKRIRRAEQF